MPGFGVQELWEKAAAVGAHHSIGVWLFLCAVSVIYAIAFISLAIQITGLVGKNGILPAHEFLAQVRKKFGQRCYFEVPTLCWVNHSDRFLQSLCWIGAAVSLLAAAGVAQLPALIVAWICYLSLFSVSRLFLGYQWDSLLLETGFLAIFLAPAQIVPNAIAPPPWPILIVLYWLLFRLMFLSGLVKLRSGDPTWKRLTALCHHYETQPMPTPAAWLLHQLPAPFHRVSTLLMFAIELGAPFLIFAPVPFRRAAGLMIIGLMLLIMLSGNYCFFNLLAMALCLPLFENSIYAAIPGWNFTVAQPAETWPLFISILVALFLVALSVIRLLRLFRAESRIVRATGWFLDTYPIVNHYGLFSVMTTTRLEIIVEGSRDGTAWLPYEFKFKPGDPKRAPPWVAPHQPRLDWQMWFAALGDYRHNGWFIGFLIRLLQGSPEVLGLLRHNPFGDTPPLYVRAVVYEYHFTTRPERRDAGSWWRREKRWWYCPVYSLAGPQRQFVPDDF
jgi:lipase maturation factor 1